MNPSVLDTVRDITQPPSLVGLLLLFACVGVGFGLLETLRPAVRRRWVRPGLLVDVTYWFFTPIFTKSLTTLLIVAAAFALYLPLGWPLTTEALDGFGPVREQPLWLQVLEMLIIADFIGYWIHRLFHGERLWKVHAVHHSPTQLDWLSAYRMHPFNDAVARIAQVMPQLLLGFSPKVLIPYVPFIVLYVVFLHSNVRCPFGWFRFVLVSPAYHRWHHTSDEEGLDCNFATMFPIWDIAFGTCHMPTDREPIKFGVKDNAVPLSFVGQMLHPFGWNREPAQADMLEGRLPEVSHFAASGRDINLETAGCQMCLPEKSSW